MSKVLRVSGHGPAEEELPAPTPRHRFSIAINFVSYPTRNLRVILSILNHRSLPPRSGVNVIFDFGWACAGAHDDIF